MKQTITFALKSGNTYTRKENGYCFVEANGKKTRCSAASFEMAQKQYEKESAEIADAIEAEAAKEVAVEVKKAKKRSRKSKDVAFKATYVIADDKIADVTLTAKQVDFIKHLPDTDFWQDGLDSTPWTDVLADQIGGQFAGKPMTTGAMISTICEKGLAERRKDKINNRTCTYMELTDLGKLVAKDLGLAD